jgi:hypothetical protein
MPIHITMTFHIGNLSLSVLESLCYLFPRWKGTGRMSEQLTPEAASEALASADRMARAGHRRAWWPRWAMAAESLMLAALMIALGLPQTRFGGEWFGVSLGLFLAGLLFRGWCIRKFGAVARPNAIDAAMTVMLLLCVAAVWYLPKLYGWMWAPWAIGIGYAVTRMIRYEFGRRGQPAAMAQDGKV